MDVYKNGMEGEETQTHLGTTPNPTGLVLQHPGNQEAISSIKQRIKEKQAKEHLHSKRAEKQNSLAQYFGAFQKKSQRGTD